MTSIMPAGPFGISDPSATTVRITTNPRYPLPSIPTAPSRAFSLSLHIPIHSRITAKVSRLRRLTMCILTALTVPTTPRRYRVVVWSTTSGPADAGPTLSAYVTPDVMLRSGLLDGD